MQADCEEVTREDKEGTPTVRALRRRYEAPEGGGGAMDKDGGVDGTSLLVSREMAVVDRVWLYVVVFVW